MPLERKPSETMGERGEVSAVIVAKCEIVEVNNNIEYVTTHRYVDVELIKTGCIALFKGRYLQQRRRKGMNLTMETILSTPLAV